MEKQIIAVDLGGTQIRTARYDHDLKLLQRENTLTRAEMGPDFTIDRMKTYIAKVMPKRVDDVLGIGISSPGPLNPNTGVIMAPPNLPAWRDVPLSDIIAKEFGLPVFIGNDANVAALAEASDWRGARLPACRLFHNQHRHWLWCHQRRQAACRAGWSGCRTGTYPHHRRYRTKCLQLNWKRQVRPSRAKQGLPLKMAPIRPCRNW